MRGIPSCSVANQAITGGSSARCFAQYMQIHTLEATGGQYHSQMPRYATADGKGTNNASQALTAKGQALLPIIGEMRRFGHAWLVEDEPVAV